MDYPEKTQSRISQKKRLEGLLGLFKRYNNNDIFLTKKEL